MLSWIRSSPESMQAQQWVLMLHLRKSLGSVNRAVQLAYTTLCDKMTALSMRSIDHRLIFSDCAFISPQAVIFLFSLIIYVWPMSWLLSYVQSMLLLSYFFFIRCKSSASFDDLFCSKLPHCLKWISVFYLNWVYCHVLDIKSCLDFVPY